MASARPENDQDGSHQNGEHPIDFSKPQQPVVNPLMHQIAYHHSIQEQMLQQSPILQALQTQSHNPNAQVMLQRFIHEMHMRNYQNSSSGRHSVSPTSTSQSSSPKLNDHGYYSDITSIKTNSNPCSPNGNCQKQEHQNQPCSSRKRKSLETEGQSSAKIHRESPNPIPSTSSESFMSKTPSPEPSTSHQSEPKSAQHEDEEESELKIDVDDDTEKPKNTPQPTLLPQVIPQIFGALGAFPGLHPTQLTYLQQREALINLAQTLEPNHEVPTLLQPQSQSPQMPAFPDNQTTASYLPLPAEIDPNVIAPRSPQLPTPEASMPLQGATALLGAARISSLPPHEIARLSKINPQFVKEVAMVDIASQCEYNQFCERMLQKLNEEKSTKGASRRTSVENINDIVITPQMEAEGKDRAYFERRRKNNEAAKRSRDSRRQKEQEVAIRCQFLDKENTRLRLAIAQERCIRKKLQDKLEEQEKK